MKVLPVLMRELQSQCRQWSTYGLRLVSTSALLLAGVLFWVDHGLALRSGGPLFQTLHCVLFWSIWCVMPLLAADSISQERRKGTLGLLLLTKLSCQDVVWAKGLVCALRGAPLFVAALPVLLVPLLLGGVSRSEVIASLALNAVSFCLALAAGLLASANNYLMHRAMLGAAVRALAFLISLWFLHGVLIACILDPYPFLSDDRPGLQWIFYEGRYGTLFLDNLWGNSWTRRFAAAANQYLTFLVFLPVCALVFLEIIVWASALVLRRRWRDVPRPPAAQTRFGSFFCAPQLARRSYRRWKTRVLERNPVGWLAQRTWRARLVGWGWLAVLAYGYGVLVNDATWYTENFRSWQTVVAILFLATMAFSAATSFRSERETGLLELLLVSPLGVRTLVLGRLRAIWFQFFPAFLLLMAVWLSMIFQGESVYGPPTDVNSNPEAQVRWTSEFIPCLMMVLGFLAVPVIGFYFSLRHLQFITALAWSLGVGLVLPLVLMVIGFQLFPWLGREALGFPVWLSPYDLLIWLAAAAVQILVALFLFRRLLHLLRDPLGWVGCK